MDEEIIKLLVEQWSLPEDKVREFIKDLLLEKEPTLENIRSSAVQMIHSMILSKGSN